MTIPTTLAEGKAIRQYVPVDFRLTDWASVAPYFNELKERAIDSVSDLESWLRDRSELESFIGEESRWRYIRTTVDTLDKEAEKALEFYYSEIQPRLETANFELNRKLVECPFLSDLDKEKYFVFLREIRNDINLYREENLPLFTELSIKQNEYGAIVGKMSIEYNGQVLTLPQASNLLKENDRSLRETIYRKVNSRRLEDKDQLDELFDHLLQLRQKVAANAGFENYRDYKFAAMGRFDYTPADCESFQQAVASEVKPLVAVLNEQRRKALGVDTLRPWDMEVDLKAAVPLHPFDNGQQLAERSIACLDQLDPFFSECLRIMQRLGRLDLDSRIGKAPGGYNMSMPETGVPFVFMNAASSDRDVKTMVHEMGHAVHSFLSHELELEGFKNYPSEVAELASMSMEQFTMDYWNVFYPEQEQLVRSKKNQLEGIIKILPWIATIDKFQHWLYLHQGHTPDERNQAFVRIYDEFHPSVDFSGLEQEKAYMWQKQLHLYEVPFYYIEYGMAQLGAVAMWKQYKESPKQAIENYKAALQMGYTRPIGEIYERAGISFRFDRDYIRELMQFLKREYEAL
ncbi:MAG: M3 family oligoendopeptidase [Chitinophagales bacterium]|nr:M3 family oligoendopeptidase [Chitinophagales bacterium]